MINLLPPREKQELKLGEVQIKISVIFAYFLCCLAFLVIIFFLLDHYIVLETVEFDSAVLTKTRELESYKFQDFEEATTKINQTLAMIGIFQQDEILISPFFEEIDSLAQQDIFFTNITLTKDVRLVQKKESEKLVRETYVRINLAGISSTREALYSFKKILESQKHFSQVYFSPDSWTKSQNAVFSVSFEIVYNTRPL